MAITKLMCGNVELFQTVCEKCGEKVLSGTGQFDCLCGNSFSEMEVSRKKRVSVASCNRRTKPSLAGQKRILEEQGFRCYWCNRWFNSIIRRHGKVYHLKIHWDHRIPYSYSFDNEDSNFVAACNFCNSFKHDKVFPFDDECRKYLHYRWKEDLNAGIIEELFESDTDDLIIDED